MSRYDEVELPNLPFGKIIKVAVIAIAAIVAISILWSGTLYTVDADEICVKQNAMDGALQFWKESGPHLQLFGKVTCYKRSSQYSFSSSPTQGGKTDESIKVRFNDGGHGNLSGTLRWEMPVTDAQLLMLHTKFGSFSAIEQQLIRPVVERSVLMTGPLMSSKESSAERRSELIQRIDDQVVYGVYKTRMEERKVKDTLTGQERTVTFVHLAEDVSQPNGVFRQEVSPLVQFGVKTYSFNVNGIKYDDTVEGQIQQQQALTMQVQTAIANARKAEQDALTTAKQGEAAATKAEWDQKVVKATEVGSAEKAKEVAKIQWETAILVAEGKVTQAELFKKESRLLGEGEAARRAAVLQADGALDQKIKAFVEVNRIWAEQLGKQKWVPDIQMGAGGGGENQAMALMQMIAVKTARDLQLDTGIHK